MKKYRLLKDIPGDDGLIKAGSVLYQNVDGGWFSFSPSFNESWPEEYLKMNPEFFEEVTRWKPESEQSFFVLHSPCIILRFYWKNIEQDLEYYNSGNCFKTREQAEHARDEIKKLLLSLHENE